MGEEWQGTGWFKVGGPTHVLGVVALTCQSTLAVDLIQTDWLLNVYGRILGMSVLSYQGTLYSSTDKASL
jgi:hypothetical protein